MIGGSVVPTGEGIFFLAATMNAELAARCNEMDGLPW